MSDPKRDPFDDIPDAFDDIPSVDEPAQVQLADLDTEAEAEAKRADDADFRPYESPEEIPLKRESRSAYVDPSRSGLESLLDHAADGTYAAAGGMLSGLGMHPARVAENVSELANDVRAGYGAAPNIDAHRVGNRVRRRTELGEDRSPKSAFVGKALGETASQAGATWATGGGAFAAEQPLLTGAVSGGLSGIGNADTDDWTSKLRAGTEGAGYGIVGGEVGGAVAAGAARAAPVLGELARKAKRSGFINRVASSGIYGGELRRLADNTPGKIEGIAELGEWMEKKGINSAFDNAEQVGEKLESSLGESMADRSVMLGELQKRADAGKPVMVKTGKIADSLDAFAATRDELAPKSYETQGNYAKSEAQRIRDKSTKPEHDTWFDIDPSDKQYMITPRLDPKEMAGGNLATVRGTSLTSRITDKFPGSYVVEAPTQGVPIDYTSPDAGRKGMAEGMAHMRRVTGADDRRPDLLTSQLVDDAMKRDELSQWDLRKGVDATPEQIHAKIDEWLSGQEDGPGTKWTADKLQAEEPIAYKEMARQAKDDFEKVRLANWKAPEGIPDQSINSPEELVDKWVEHIAAKGGGEHITPHVREQMLEAVNAEAARRMHKFHLEDEVYHANGLDVPASQTRVFYDPEYGDAPIPGFLNEPYNSRGDRAKQINDRGWPVRGPYEEQTYAGGEMPFHQSLANRQAYDDLINYRQIGGPAEDSLNQEVHREAVTGFRTGLVDALKEQAPQMAPQWQQTQHDISNSLDLLGPARRRQMQEAGNQAISLPGWMGMGAGAAAGGPAAAAAAAAGAGLVKSRGRSMLASGLGASSRGMQGASNALGKMPDPSAGLAMGAGVTGGMQVEVPGHELGDAAMSVLEREPAALGKYQAQFAEAAASNDTAALRALISKLTLSDPDFRRDVLPSIQNQGGL